jgi:hypothetical protein
MSTIQKSSTASSNTSSSSLNKLSTITTAQQQQTTPPPIPPAPSQILMSIPKPATATVPALATAPAPAPIVISESVVDVDVAVPVAAAVPIEVVAPVDVQTQIVAVVPETVQGKDNILLTRLAQLYDYSKSILDTKKITTTNIIMIMNNLIQIVEQYKELTGNQKKMLVLDTIKKIINENVTDENNKQQLILFVNITLPVILDSIILAINGDMKFAKEKINSCFSKLFSCCKC